MGFLVGVSVVGVLGEAIRSRRLCKCFGVAPTRPPSSEPGESPQPRFCLQARGGVITTCVHCVHSFRRDIVNVSSKMGPLHEYYYEYHGPGLRHCPDSSSHLNGRLRSVRPLASLAVDRLKQLRRACAVGPEDLPACYRSVFKWVFCWPLCVEHSHDGSGPGHSKVMVPLSLSAIDVASSLRARLEPGQVRS